MRLYYSRETTPLKFHKFFRFVTAPLGTVLNISNLIRTFAEMEAFTWLYAIDTFYILAYIACLITCFVGFFHWRSYAWYSVNTMLGLNVAYRIFGIIAYAAYIPSEIASAIGGLIGCLIYVIPTWIYYKKRRPLFFPDAHQPVLSEPAAVANYCGQCGWKLSPHDRFCGQCGAAISNIPQ